MTTMFGSVIPTSNIINVFLSFKGLDSFVGDE